MLTRHIATYSASQGWQERQRQGKQSFELDRIKKALTENSPKLSPRQNISTPPSLANSNNVPRKKDDVESDGIVIEMVEPTISPSEQQDSVSGKTKSQQPTPAHIDLPLKDRIFAVLEYPNSSRLAFGFNFFILVIVLLSIVTFLVGSMGKYWKDPPSILRILDIMCGAVFLVEYSLKLATAPDKLQWVRKTESIIDLLAISPLIIEAFMTLSADTAAVSLVRLLRLFRILKLARFSHTVTIVGTTIRRAKDALFLLVFLVTLCLLVCSSLMFYAEQAEQTYDSKREKWVVQTALSKAYLRHFGGLLLPLPRRGTETSTPSRGQEESLQC